LAQAVHWIKPTTSSDSEPEPMVNWLDVFSLPAIELWFKDHREAFARRMQLAVSKAVKLSCTEFAEGTFSIFGRALADKLEDPHVAFAAVRCLVGFAGSLDYGSVSQLLSTKIIREAQGPILDKLEQISWLACPTALGVLCYDLRFFTDSFKVSLETLQGTWRHSIQRLGSLTVDGNLVAFHGGLKFDIDMEDDGRVDVGGWKPRRGKYLSGDQYIVWEQANNRCTWSREASPKRACLR